MPVTVGLALLATVVLTVSACANLGGADPRPLSATANPTEGAAGDSVPALPTPAASPVAAPATPIVTTPAPTPTASPSAQPTPAATAEPPPAGYAPLNGMPAEAEVALRLPLAVMIDNNLRARPQSGFNRASIVYQSPNDGGTDRYMFVFQEQDAELVGPVRSTRLFFVDWAIEYRSALAHFGGDWKAVKLVAQLNGELIFDVDAMAGSSRAYWRDKKRRAPYNAYSTTARLWAEAERRGAPAQMVAGLPVRKFAADLPASQRPTRGSITVPYRSGTVSYAYESRSNSYLRSIAGKPHRDGLDGERVTARNVIVQYVSVYYDPNQRYNRAVMQTTGTGRAIVFRDGLAINGTWRKERAADLTRFYDEAGDEITLVRGRIFIQVVSARTKVTFEVGRTP